MNRYWRIEINAYRRCMTVVSGEWSLDAVTAASPVETEDGVSLVDSDVGEPIAPESIEGQVLLAEAVRCLQRRLSPEAQATLLTSHDDCRSSRTPVYFSLRSLCDSLRGVLRLSRKHRGTGPEKSIRQDST